MLSPKRQELLLYAAIWTLVFILVPPLSFGFRFNWQDVLSSWMAVLPFFLLFAAHNFGAAPLLETKKYLLYALLTGLAVIVFGAVCFIQGDRPMEGPPPFFEDDALMRPRLSPEIMKIIIGILILCANLGIKAIFKMLEKERHIHLLQTTMQDDIRRGTKAEPQIQEAPDTIQFKVNYKTISVRLDDIRYIESMSEYVKIWLRSQAYPLVVLYSLKRLTEQLPKEKFLRIHRSYIISKSLIRENTAATLTLEGGTTLPIGESFRPAVKEYLSQRH